MVGRSGENRFGAVDLLEGYEQREFVLEGLRTQRPKQIGPRARGLVPSIGCADKERETRHRAVAELLDFRRKGAAGKGFSTFIEKHTMATIGKLKHPLVQVGAGFDKVALNLGKAPQSPEVILDADFGKIERRLAGSDDFPGQR